VQYSFLEIYHISGNFRVVKFSCFHISCNNNYFRGPGLPMKFFYSRRPLTSRWKWSRSTKGTASCVTGYHVYQAIWEVAVGEVFTYERESGNITDRHTVAVKNRTIIGHLMRKVLRVCSLFLRRGGTIRCTVTGIRRCSGDLPQGALKSPASWPFTTLLNPKNLPKWNSQ